MYWHKDCESCRGPGREECIICIPPLVFENSICMETCSASYYFNMRGNKCLRCFSRCVTCFASTPRSCLSCETEEGLYLIEATVYVFPVTQGSILTKQQIYVINVIQNAKRAEDLSKPNALNASKGKFIHMEFVLHVRSQILNYSLL